MDTFGEFRKMKQTSAFRHGFTAVLMLPESYVASDWSREYEHEYAWYYLEHAASSEAFSRCLARIMA